MTHILPPLEGTDELRDCPLDATCTTMVPTDFYAACAVCALGFIMLMRASSGESIQARSRLKTAAVVVILGGVGWLFATCMRNDDLDASAILLAASGFVSVCGAAQVLSHPRPLFAALFFILIIVSGAAAYILLDASFMAFALVIVYAGAILITYMFVLMLAEHRTPGSEEAYDRFPREPIIAVLIGSALLAVLGSAIFGSAETSRDAGVQSALASRDDWMSLNRMPRLLQAEVSLAAPGARLVAGETYAKSDASHLHVINGQPVVRVLLPGATQPSEVILPAGAMISNPRAVGLALVEDFPVSLELAGVILMMALFGAVLLARRQVEHAEDERREAARSGATVDAGNGSGGTI